MTGIPSGRQAALTASSAKGKVHHLGTGCRRSSRGYTCTASRGHSQFVFTVHSHSETTLVFTVTPPDGFVDPAPGNNRATVRVPGRPSSTPTKHPTPPRDPDDGPSKGPGRGDDDDRARKPGWEHGTDRGRRGHHSG